MCLPQLLVHAVKGAWLKGLKYKFDPFMDPATSL